MAKTLLVFKKVFLTRFHDLNFQLKTRQFDFSSVSVSNCDCGLVWNGLSSDNQTLFDCFSHQQSDRFRSKNLYCSLVIHRCNAHRNTVKSMVGCVAAIWYAEFKKRNKKHPLFFKTNRHSSGNYQFLHLKTSCSCCWWCWCW